MSVRAADIVVPADLQRQVKALMALAAPVASAAMERILRPVYDNAVANWPVRTPRKLWIDWKTGEVGRNLVTKDSRGKLALEFTTRGGGFVATLINRAPYAVFIHDSDAWRDLMLNPAKAAFARIGAEVIAEFARQEARN